MMVTGWTPVELFKPMTLIHLLQSFAALVVIALNPILLFYGRYGVSLTATFLAVLVLLLVSLRLFDPTVKGWRFGLLGGAVLQNDPLTSVR